MTEEVGAYGPPRAPATTAAGLPRARTRTAGPRQAGEQTASAWRLGGSRVVAARPHRRNDGGRRRA
jgi:hypothetical protein